MDHIAFSERHDISIFHEMESVKKTNLNMRKKIKLGLYTTHQIDIQTNSVTN